MIIEPSDALISRQIYFNYLLNISKPYNILPKIHSTPFSEPFKRQTSSHIFYSIILRYVTHISFSFVNLNSPLFFPTFKDNRKLVLDSKVPSRLQVPFIRLKFTFGIDLTTKYPPVAK